MRAQLASIAAIAMIAGTAQSQIINPSFENPGFPDVFDGWGQFGSNINPDLDELILDGDVACKIFGQFIGARNDSGLFQTVGAANPGEIWEAEINVGHLTGDELQPGAAAFLSLVFIDGNGVNLFDEAIDALLPADPTDTYLNRTVSAVAPLGTAQVQIVIGFSQAEPTSDVNGDTVIDAGDQAGGAAHYDLAAVNFVSAGNAIPFRNGSFENGVFGREFESWTAFGNSIGNVGQNFEVPSSDGDASCFIYGQFNGVQNDSGVFQSVPAAAGENWEASVKVRPNPGDEPGEGNTATLSLVFLDGSGNVLADNPVLAADHTTSSAGFSDVSVSAVAPAGTAEAQIVLVYSQGEPLSDVNGDTVIDGGDQPTGAIIFDEANLQIASAGVDCCDVNGDGACTATDFSAWVGAFNSGAPNCDVNQDGSCTPTDFSAWVGAYNASNAGNPSTCNF
ncbi:MAG: GC-type dockerin domain-anchored protein [Phycisphaerales bacterium JB061]